MYTLNNDNEKYFQQTVLKCLKTHKKLKTSQKLLWDVK